MFANTTFIPSKINKIILISNNNYDYSYTEVPPKLSFKYPSSVLFALFGPIIQ